MRGVRPGRNAGVCALVAVLAYLSVLIIHFPATWMDARLAEASQGMLRIADAQGSVWSGSGSLEVRDQGQRIGNLQRLHWRLLPDALLHGRLAFEGRFGSSDRPLRLSVHPTGVELTGATVELPAAIIGLAVPRLSTLELGGQLLLKIDRLRMGRGRLEGDASVDWQGARSALTPVSPLGNYAMQFRSDGALANVTLRTLQGPLQLEGQGVWPNGDHPVFSGHARVPPALRQQLTPLLRLITVESSAGNFQFQFPQALMTQNLTTIPAE